MLKGIIVAGEMDERKSIVSAVLATDQEQDFLIERDAKGDELFDHLREPVQVKGVIGEDGKGRRTIKIIEYQLLDF
jgi:hypothetical protein